MSAGSKLDSRVIIFSILKNDKVLILIDPKVLYSFIVLQYGGVSYSTDLCMYKYNKC